MSAPESGGAILRSVGIPVFCMACGEDPCGCVKHALHCGIFEAERCDCDRAEISALRARVAELEKAATYASAELRHAYRWPPIDPNLVSRAIQTLERVVSPALDEPPECAACFRKHADCTCPVEVSS